MTLVPLMKVKYLDVYIFTRFLRPVLEVSMSTGLSVLVFFMLWRYWSLSFVNYEVVTSESVWLLSELSKHVILLLLVFLLLILLASPLSSACSLLA